MAYAETDELFRRLKLNRGTPSAESVAAAERVLEMAAFEIDKELDLASDATVDAAGLALLEEVNLQRAAELWSRGEVPLGIVGLTSEMAAPTHLVRDSWRTYAVMLAPLKDQRGFA